MTIDEALANGRFQLSPHSPTPLLDARLLLQFVLNVNHTYLIAHGDESLTAVNQQQYSSFLNRAAKKEPIPYITQIAPFFDLDLYVTPDVLIPRPETELLVEKVVEWEVGTRRFAENHGGSQRGALQVVDVGCGSGCIPIMLARRLPDAQVDAVDISAAALAVAKQNASQFASNRIQFHQGDLLTPISHSCDLISANLPYITDEEWTMLDDGVKLYEPSLALKGGVDGIDLIDRLLQQATSKLSATGAIFLEIGWQQGTAVSTLATSHFPNAHIDRIQDYAGHDRIITIKRE